MLQGDGGAPSAFVRLMRCVIASLDFVWIHPDDMVVFDASSTLDVERIQASLVCLEEHVVAGTAKSLM